ncbi:MAG: very short patch repair endonuclease [Chlorobi bacterium]|nr:very short patch repair endonuclease [Chlorobiota bacterium]
MDRHTSEQRRRNMQAVKSTGTKIEIILGKALWKKGFRYRKNVKTIFGKPDFVFNKYKIAVFCDSEFWHGKNWETKKYEIKSNRDFWYKKIERNIERDVEVNTKLKKEGWTVLRFWGQEILKNTDNCVKQIETEISKRT